MKLARLPARNQAEAEFMRSAPLYIRLAAVLAGAALLAAPLPVMAFSRVKDLIEVQGIRDNMLVGYGLVVGLNGTGDSLKNAPFTQQSIQTMLERLGVNTRGQTMQTKNVAAVMVTASLPAFASQGSRIDISVSALGDAIIKVVWGRGWDPLLAADGEIYAVAKDMIAVGGFKAEGAAASVELYHHPAVREALVIGIRDEEAGEVPKAFVSLREGATATGEGLRDWLNPQLGKHERVAAVEIRDALPKTLVGKLSRKELVAEEKAKAAALNRP